MGSRRTRSFARATVQEPKARVLPCHPQVQKGPTVREPTELDEPPPKVPRGGQIFCALAGQPRSAEAVAFELFQHAQPRYTRSNDSSRHDGDARCRLVIQSQSLPSPRDVVTRSHPTRKLHQSQATSQTTTNDLLKETTFSNPLETCPRSNNKSNNTSDLRPKKAPVSHVAPRKSSENYTSHQEAITSKHVMPCEQRDVPSKARPQ